jgi:hypothetical protein
MLLSLLNDRRVDLMSVEQSTGVSYSTLWHWVYKGSRPVLDESVLSVANYFSVSIEYLAFGIGLDPEEKDSIIKQYESEISKLKREVFLLQQDKNQLSLFSVS